MPKLRRRLRVGGVNLVLPTNISSNMSPTVIVSHSTDTSGVSQASSSQSVQQDERPIMSEFRCVCIANDNDDVAVREEFKAFSSNSINLGC